MKKIYFILLLSIILSFAGGWYSSSLQIKEPAESPVVSSEPEVRFSPPPAFKAEIVSISNTESEIIISIDPKDARIIYPVLANNIVKTVFIDENTALTAGKKISVDIGDKNISLSELQDGDTIFFWPREPVSEILKINRYTALTIKKITE